MKQKILVSNTRKHVIPLTLFVFLFVFSIYGCASTKVGSSAVANYNSNPLTVVIPAGLSSEIVENAMVDTVVNRKWVLQSRSQTEVIASLKHRAYDATVTLQSDGSIITILNEATYKDSNSGEIKPGVPMGWVGKYTKRPAINTYGCTPAINSISAQ